MLNHCNAFGSFSVNDIKAAKEFYGVTLGLDVESQKMETDDIEMLGLNFRNGTRMMIYPKSDHRPSEYTVLNLEVDDVLSEVKTLKEKGVKFEHYDGNDENEINHAEGMDIAWFKDPAGNYISLIKQQEILGKPRLISDKSLERTEVTIEF